MKQKLAFVLSFVVMASGAFAQMTNSSKSSSKKGSSIGIHFNSLDIKTPQTFKNNSGPKTLAGFKDQDFGFSVSYWKGLTSHLELSVRANLMFHDYASEDRNSYTTKTNQTGLELEPALNLYAFNHESLFNMFLTAGIGGGYYTGEVGAYVPTGLGMQVNFNNQTFMMLQAQYRFTLTKDVERDNLFYSIGVAQRIGSDAPKVVPPPPPPVVLDRDGDGINDVDDKCPDTPGLAALQGCPDRDGDGIADAEDKCPDVAGLAKYSGCPIPDTDGDGVNDEEDKCVTVKGLARYQGCPIPDTDGDGVNDEEDKCPNRVGPADNFGCPVIGIRAYEIAFKSGSAVLLPKGKQILDTVVTYLNNNPGVNVTVEGHTDNSGTDKINQPLSEKRALASKAYMVSKGIDPLRMTTAGYGSTQPVADNKTADGRKKNRRIEIKIKQ